jgi:lysophospholipase L1-like esterase
MKVLNTRLYPLLLLILAGCGAEPDSTAPAASANTEAPATVVAAAEPHWIGTWGASPFGFQGFGPAAAPTPFADQTLRQKLRISVGGDQVRVRFSNELGTTPLVIGAATVALATGDSSIDSASMKTLTFGGATSITIPPGAPALTDAVDMNVADLTELAISIYLPEEAAPATLHMGRSTYVATGDATGAASLDGAELTTNHVFLTGVYVRTTDDAAVVVTLGDSITDGTASTPHTYSSWPDQFAARVATGSGGRKIAVVNHGISGNQVLRDGAGTSALTRFDRDVLSTPGLSHIVLLEGINDIGTGGFAFPGTNAAPPPERTAAELIAGYQQLIARAHANGVKIYGATLTPFEGSFAGYYSPAKDEVRSELNEWIRTSGAFDGVIDFEAATQDTTNPRIIKAEYDSGDHLHPGDAGYKAMADSIDPALFQ